MNRMITLTAAIWMGSTVGLAAQIDNYTPYHVLLAKDCNSKHLEWLSPAELNDLIVQDFRGQLSSREKAAVDRFNNEKIECADVTMGATCETVSYLRAMTKAQILPRFAKFVCETGKECKGQSDCH